MQAVKLLFLFFCLSCKQEQPQVTSKSIQEKKVGQLKNENKNSLRIDYINSFQDSSLHYITGIQRNDDEIDYESIDKEARKKPIKIYDEYSSRYALPIPFVKKYFNFDSVIWIYNIHSQLIGKGKYVRHELYDESISSSYVAVYRIDTIQIKGHHLFNIPFFYSNNRSEDFNLVKWIKNPTLSLSQKSLLTKNEYQERIENSDLKTFQYSYKGEIFTFHSDGNITIFSNKTSKSIYNLENAIIFDMSSTHFIHNEKPVFLLSCGQPETDYFYSLTLAWDGQKFIILK
jgi:hypothetical protein